MRINRNMLVCIMYVCICNGLKEKCVRSAIEGGACSVGETFRRLGCQAVCGQCVPTIRETLQSNEPRMEMAQHA